MLLGFPAHNPLSIEEKQIMDLEIKITVYLFFK